jgi:fructokinase
VARAQPIIACWGELLWDLFVAPKAALNWRKVLGGSAAAVSAQLAALGAQARLVSAVGDDPEGDRALERLQRGLVDISGVLRCRNSPTAAVLVEITAGGEPAYSAQQRLAWGNVDFEPALSRALPEADALVFSSFAQDTCLDLRALERALEHHRPHFIGCDLNLRAPVAIDYLARIAANADFVKLNQLEYERAALVLSGEDPVSWLLRSGRTQLVAVTAGAAGARLVTRTEVISHASSAPALVVDTVGAGDAFFAAMTLALLAKLPHREALARATARAELQLSSCGAMPKAPNANADESV